MVTTYNFSSRGPDDSGLHMQLHDNAQTQPLSNPGQKYELKKKNSLKNDKKQILLLVCSDEEALSSILSTGGKTTVPSLI